MPSTSTAWVAATQFESKLLLYCREQRHSARSPTGSGVQMIGLRAHGHITKKTARHPGTAGSGWAAGTHWRHRTHRRTTLTWRERSDGTAGDRRLEGRDR